METHLSSDIDFEQRFSHAERLPVHLIVGDAALRYEDCVTVKRVYYKTLGDTGWETARFTIVENEFLAEEHVRNTPARLALRGGLPTPAKSSCRARIRFAVFVTVGILYQDGGVNSTDVVRIRFVCDPRELTSSGLPSFYGRRFDEGARRTLMTNLEPRFDGSEKTVDVDLLQRDLLESRTRYAPDPPSDELIEDETSPSNAGDTHPSMSHVVDGGACEGMESPVAPLEGCGFFDISTNRRMSAQMEAYLSRFLACANGNVKATGPLEVPSVVRGIVTTDRRGVFSDELVAGYSGCEAKEPERGPLSTTAKWFSDCNVFSVVPLEDLSRHRRVYVAWYACSFWTGWKLRRRPPSPVSSIKGSLDLSFVAWSQCISSLCADVCNRLNAALACTGTLPQRFRCAISSQLDFRPILDLLCVSRDVWVNRADESGCIIKAIVERLRVTDAGKGVRYAGRGTQDADCWADVIDCVRGRVYSGIGVKLMLCPRTGLLTVQRRDGRPVSWVQDPRLCVLYARRDLSVLWCVPGGFAAEFAIRPHGGQLDIFRERFKMS